MGGAGFGQGLVQGLEAAKNRQLEMAQLKMQQQFAQSRLKAMDAEDQLRQLQTQALMDKLAFKDRMPSQMASITGPQEAPLQAGAAGPTLEGRPQEPDQSQLAQFLMAAEANGYDSEKILNFAVLSDPTGTVKQWRDEMRPPQFMQMGPYGIVEITHNKSGKPPSAPSSQPEMPQEEEPPPQYSPEEQADITREQTRPLTQEELLAQAGQTQPSGPMPNIVPGMMPPTEPTPMPGRAMPSQPKPQAKPQPAAAPAKGGPQARMIMPGVGKQPTPEESKVIGELGALFPERMATLTQSLGHPPTYRDVTQFFTPEEFAQSFRAREDRTKENQIDVAKHTGELAAERQLAFQRQKEKIPQKPSAGERKDFADDAIAVNQAKQLIDEFSGEFVGPKRGRFGNVMEWWGSLGYDEAAFRGRLARVRNSTIKAITGAQMGEAEATRIKQELPEFNLSPEAFIARMRLTYINLYEMAVIRRQIAKETGLDLSDLKPLTPPEDLDPKIRTMLRDQGGVSPVGKATERSRQGQTKADIDEFKQGLDPGLRKKYDTLSPGDQARFRQKYYEKLETLPQGGR